MQRLLFSCGSKALFIGLLLTEKRPNHNQWEHDKGKVGVGEVGLVMMEEKNRKIIKKKERGGENRKARKHGRKWGRVGGCLLCLVCLSLLFFLCAYGSYETLDPKLVGH